ncbi:hypothetical protein MY1884_004304 [Beauveria asiatica]
MPHWSLKDLHRLIHLENTGKLARTAGGVHPTVTISTAAAAPPAVAPAAPAAAPTPAPADPSAPGRPLALVDRALLSDILLELRTVSHRLGVLVAAAGILAPAPAPTPRPAAPPACPWRPRLWLGPAAAAPAPPRPLLWLDAPAAASFAPSLPRN